MLYILNLYVMVNEKKCFYNTVHDKDILMFRYNTTDLLNDNREQIELHYKYSIQSPTGEILREGEITGLGKVEVSVTPGEYTLCLENFLPENTKYSQRQFARWIKRLNIVFEVLSQQDRQDNQDSDQQNLQKADHLLRKAKAIGSQQSGSEYRRAKIEKAGKSLKFQNKIITVITCTIYIILSVLSSKFIKKHLKAQRI